MLATFDFKCPTCDDVIEKFVKNDTKNIPCNCGDTRYKIISAPQFKWNDAHNPNSPAADKWVKMREQKMAQEAK